MAESADPIIKEETVPFSSDSQLLSELGERLIASRHVALAELIKNAHDADATECHIWLEDDKSTLKVKDDGHGMTEQEFRDFWMTIATPHRTREPTSRKYNREVTGAKGVGRFAVRNLGLELELQTVAYYDEVEEYRRLVAEFDWEGFESGTGLQEMTVDYRLEANASEEEEGTLLMISTLADSWSQAELEEVSGKVLNIVSAPYDTNRSEVASGDDEDPGFSVYFAPPGEGEPAKSVAREIYERYVAKLEMSVEGENVKYEIKYEGGDVRDYKYSLDRNLIGDIRGEIRFIPQRKGVLRGLETLDGREARGWLNENGGVRVIDKNFRMPPYGDQGNDWLSLNLSQARREREWRSPITTNVLPEENIKVRVSEAQLRLPRKSQLLGAVNVSSFRPGKDVARARTDRLVPAMDRQGFVENEAFRQLVDITRGGLEILAVVDAEEQLRKTRAKAEAISDEVVERTSSVKDTVRDREDIDLETKSELIQSIDDVEAKVIEHHKAERKAREAVESMNLLGVVAAFMSHETDLIKQSAQTMLDRWRKVPVEERSDEFQDRIKETETALESFKNHQSYSEFVMEQLAKGEEQTFKPKYQIKHIIETFETYTEKRDILVENTVPSHIETPAVNLGLYSGIFTNLYTNAIKAVVTDALGEDGRHIRFEGENTQNTHKIRVIDNGPGIPEDEKDRIFDPLYSTTEVEGPTGSGTGLGLYIVDRVLENVGGEIELVEPPEGYETSFEVRLPK